MKHDSNSAARYAIAAAVALLLCLPAVVFAQAATPLTGIVQSTNRDLNYFTISDPPTGRSLKIDVRNMDTRQSVNVWRLRAGDRVTVDGNWENSDTFRADRVAFTTYTPANASAGVYTLAGTVQGVNRKLQYVTVRDQATGRDIKIDARRMDTRESVNVWQLRPGDPIEATGMWRNRNRFEANRVSVAAFQPMTSGYGAGMFLSGTIQSVNRDLNYFTLRDDLTGQMMKVDVRRMDTRRSVNVWQLRPGDRIVVEGTSENPGAFQAETVNF